MSGVGETTHPRRREQSDPLREKTIVETKVLIAPVDGHGLVAEAGKTLEELQGGVDLVSYWQVFADGNERMVQAFVTRFQPEAVKRAWLELRQH